MTWYLWWLMYSVNVTSKSNKHLEGHSWKEQDPDPLVRGTGTLIRIHTKMSQLWNTGAYFGVDVIISIRLLKKHLRLKEKIGIPAPFNDMLSLNIIFKYFVLFAGFYFCFLLIFFRDVHSLFFVFWLNLSESHSYLEKPGGLLRFRTSFLLGQNCAILRAAKTSL